MSEIVRRPRLLPPLPCVSPLPPPTPSFALASSSSPSLRLFSYFLFLALPSLHIFGGLLLFGGLYPPKMKKSPKKCEISGLLNLGVKSPEKIRYAHIIR